VEKKDPKMSKGVGMGAAAARAAAAAALAATSAAAATVPSAMKNKTNERKMRPG